MTRGNPPQDEDRPLERLEPFPTVSEWPRMVAPVDVVAQGLARLPDRHVEEDSLVFVGPDGGSVPFIGLESPDKTGAGVGDRIDPNARKSLRYTSTNSEKLANDR